MIIFQLLSEPDGSILIPGRGSDGAKRHGDPGGFENAPCGQGRFIMRNTTITVTLPLFIAFGAPGAHASYLTTVEPGIIPYPEAAPCLDGAGQPEFLTVQIPCPISRAAALRLQDLEVWAIPYRGCPDRYMAVHYLTGVRSDVFAEPEDAVMALLA